MTAERRGAFTSGVRRNDDGETEHYTSVSGKSIKFWLGAVALLLSCVISGGTIMAAVMRPLVQSEIKQSLFDITEHQAEIERRLAIAEREQIQAHSRYDDRMRQIEQHRSEILESLREIERKIDRIKEVTR